MRLWTILGRTCGALLVGVGVLLAFASTVFVPVARANYELVGGFGEGGNGGAVNYKSGGGAEFNGNLYTVSSGVNSSNAVLRYSSQGQFLESWGYGVVATGPDLRGTLSEAELTVMATAGNFTLAITGVASRHETLELKYNVSDEEIESALEKNIRESDPGLPGVAAAEVTVTGGPGDATGSTPYRIAFGGSLRGIKLGLQAHNVSLVGTVGVTLVEGTPAFETCFPSRGDVCKNYSVPTHGPGEDEGPGQFVEPAGVAVDQATGDVYVLDSERVSDVVQVFGPAGEYIGGFGERGTHGEKVAMAPSKIHYPHVAGIAVDDTGNVYIVDTDTSGIHNAESRVMVFKPHVQGYYSEYEYVPGGDIAVGYFPYELAFDDSSGELDMAHEGTSRAIFAFVPTVPARPVCEFEYVPGGVSSLGVDPVSGDPFFYSPAGELGKLERFHELSAASCGSEGKFTPLAEFTAGGSRKLGQVNWLAFNPSLVWSAGRPPGVLYAGGGLIFARPPRVAPSVSSVSFSSVDPSSVVLSAGIDPHGNETRYVFSYLPEVAWFANEPDAVQRVSVIGEGGSFRLGFEGQETGPVSFDAPASGEGSVQAALNALPSVASDGVTATGVVVSGGEGGGPGERVYTVFFSGSGHAGVDVPLLTADASGLVGVAHSVSVAVVHHGGSGFAGAAEAPAGVLSSSQSVSPASVGVSGLLPDTVYRFTVTAVSHCNAEEPEEECVAIGPTGVFRTYPSASGLPDHRAYELVSPAQKSGGEVFPPDNEEGSCHEFQNHCNPGFQNAGMPMVSAPDGESVVYEGDAFCPEPGVGPICAAGTGAANENEYLATRTATGWHTRDLSPIRESKDVNNGGYDVFTPDLSRGLLLQSEPALSPEAPVREGKSFANLYTQVTSAPGALRPLLTAEPPNRDPGASSLNEFIVVYGGASEDLSHVVFGANDALTGETPVAQPALPGTNLYEWSDGGGLRLVNVAPGNASTVPGAMLGSGTVLSVRDTAGPLAPDFSHVISADGSRVFWSTGGGLFVRIGGSETREIPGSGAFLTASSDGSRVLRTSGELYDLQTEGTVDLTGGQGGFQGILGASEDLSSVYFVDTAVLTGAQQNSAGSAASAGGDNLYLYREGSVPVFIATLSVADSKLSSLLGPPFDWVASPSDRTAQASPHGDWLAFESVAPLTGYDNLGIPEVFLYDAQNGRLACASCDPSLAPPLDPSGLDLIDPNGGTFTAQPHALTDTGRLFFDSEDVLSPSDRNGVVGDVYEYEPQGLGTCEVEMTEGGCVSLISSGQGSTDAQFVNADPEARNAFFTTRSQLVPQDRDELVDLYDARENGGFSETSEVESASCGGEACKGTPASPVEQPSPGSDTLQGPGNLPPGSSSGSGGSSPTGSVVPLTRAQKLVRALSACKRQRARKKRTACEASAHKKYGPSPRGKRAVSISRHTRAQNSNGKGRR